MPTCSVPPSSPTARLPATTPTKISTSATEIPVRIEIKLADSASPIQAAAINQILSSIKNSFLVGRSHQLTQFSPAATEEGKLHCLGRTLQHSLCHVEQVETSRFTIESIAMGFLDFA